MTPQERKQFKGTLCVYRDGSMRQTLSAQVLLDGGHKLHYYRVPKCFDKLIADGQRNVIDIEFVANEDGSNPRGVVASSAPR